MPTYALVNTNGSEKELTAADTVPEGTATVTVKGMGDYGGSKTVKFRITAKPLAALVKF